MLSLQRPRHTVAESGQTIEVTSPDHLLVNAILDNGMVASIHVHDAKVGESRIRIEIAGTQGDLAIVSAAADDPLGVQLQISTLRLLATHGTGGSWQDVPVPESYRTAPNTTPVEARNVAALYAQLASDIRTGNQGTPDFEAGLHLHRLLDTIRRSAESGTRQPTQP